MRINSYFELECICRSLAMAFKAEKGLENWDKPFGSKDTVFEYLTASFPDCKHELLSEVWEYIAGAYDEELSRCYSR